MKVVVTGGAGFLGQRLVAALLRRGRLRGPDGSEQPIDALTVLDRFAPAAVAADPRLKVIEGDIADPQVVAGAIGPDVGAVFHLAAVVSSQAEADFDLGLKVNLDAARLVLEACRGGGRCPRVLFTSSVAVYGGIAQDLVNDDTALTPRSSYGAQKAIAELLLSDYSRKGFVDGRILRLPTISVRPGRPNQAASSFASGIIREPLNGETAVCPVPAETRLWLLSPRRAIESMITGMELPSATLGDNRAINLPGLSVSVREMVDALARAAGPEVAERIRWEPDATITSIVGSWPPAWDTRRAEALGFEGDPDFAAIIEAFRNGG